MIIFDAVNRSLEFKLAGVVATSELPFVASWADHTASAFTPGHTDGISNGTTAVTLVAAPAASTQRQLKTVTIFNDDTAAAVVIVQYNNNSTIRQITQISVPANGTLVYTDGEGFRVINSAGQILTSAPDGLFSNVAATITAGWIFEQEIDAQAGIDISGGGLKIGGSTVIDASENADFGGTLAVGGLVSLAGDLALGATPAAAGDLRFTNNKAVKWRNAANDGDIQGFIVNASDKVVIANDDITILATGLVGINQGTPTAELHVVSGAADRVALIVDSASSPSANLVEFQENGTLRQRMSVVNDNFYSLQDFDNGANRGCLFQLGRNNKAGTPASGVINWQNKGGTFVRVWVDATEDMRLWSGGEPTHANDLSGVVVGDQTSWIEKKDILGSALPAEDAVRSVAALVFDQFTYKETGYNQWDGSPPVFNGLVVRTRKDWWGKNMGPHQTPALNEIELFARYGLTIQSLIAEVKALGGFTWL